MAGAKAAGSFINAVIITSVISAGNHALFVGTRLMYSLTADRHAPQFLGKLNRNKVPWIAVLVTSVVSGLCFGASFVGAGQLWTWLQNLVGVSNQLAWLAIGVTSLRVRMDDPTPSEEILTTTTVPRSPRTPRKDESPSI
jgi:AAT family amino acid transporter